MSEKRILELFNNVDEKYIDEASPQNVKILKFMFSPIIVAACLCLLLIGGWGMSRFMQKNGEEKYYTTNMDEVLAAYEGELLVEKISYEGASDTNILLCYTGNDLPLSSDEWKTLSVSASYEDYDMTLNCAFNGETFITSGEKAIDTIQYGDTTIQIYQGETTPEFELTYYAVFEYQNVCYELKTYSNDKERIYEILQTVLGVNEEDSESSSIGEHGFTDVLGYSDYHVTVDQNSPGFVIQKYYAEVDGVEKCIAQVFGYAVPGPEVYSRDLDENGIKKETLEEYIDCLFKQAERIDTTINEEMNKRKFEAVKLYDENIIQKNDCKKCLDFISVGRYEEFLKTGSMPYNTVEKMLANYPYGYCPAYEQKCCLKECKV